MALDASAPAAHWRSQFPPGPLFKEIHELRTLSQLVKRVSGRISKGAEPPEKRAPAPKPPPPLPNCFLLSHLEEDGPVRTDGVKLGVSEVLGLELDESKLGAFAGALNALDFPAQLLVRQHPPRLERLKSGLEEARPEGLPQRTREAADSLNRLLSELEARDGILDRRFYAVCEFERAGDLRGLLARAGLSVHPLGGRALRMFLVSAFRGGSPGEFDGNAPLSVEVNRRDMRIGDTLVRSLHLGKWPRSLSPGFLQGLMAAGAPMDLSIHLGAIPAEQAARTLEWQKVRFESAQSLSLRRGRTMSSEAEIALEDVTRLRDEVQRGGRGSFTPPCPSRCMRRTRHPSRRRPSGPGPTSPRRLESSTPSPSARGRDSYRACRWGSTQSPRGARSTPPAWRGSFRSRRPISTPGAARSTA